MTESQSAPNNEPPIVTDFRKKYGEALARAAISAEHTATEGWQDLYGQHIQRIKKAREDTADRLKIVQQALAQRLLTSEEEKDLAEIKKEATGLRELAAAFHSQVLDPIIAPMRECDQIINAATAEANEAVRQSPLTHREISDIMQTVIDTMPRVKFMIASGRLIVGNG